jgi:hypothetical protein
MQFQHIEEVIDKLLQKYNFVGFSIEKNSEDRNNISVEIELNREILDKEKNKSNETVFMFRSTPPASPISEDQSPKNYLPELWNQIFIELMKSVQHQYVDVTD